ncbi:MAG: 16S rRNA (cytosine(967)-C(5))-methyltransferase RsmB [Ruminococcus sp.]|nr:16S rRNA (cytosine(967)-C(5))-methyltransferase RsmB [Ruminococcus sp.]
MNGRKLAIQLLDRTEQEKSYSNLLLDHALSQSQMDDVEKRLCAMLYYGVIKRRITLDAVIQKYSKQPLRKLDRTVRNILRIGIFQLLYCDQIPAHAAVSESVKLTRTLRKASASGFVNAVLRGFLRDACQIPYPQEKNAAMAVEYAVPDWLLETLLAAYGEEQTRSFLADVLLPAPRYIRRNPLRCGKEELEQALGEKLSPVKLVPDAYLLRAGDLRHLPEFQKGWFYVQDLASQICALALGAEPGETILDLCAAPGGKTCTIATQMQDQGHVYAFDLTEHRVRLIAENVKRLGLHCVTPLQGDACEAHPAYAGADRVLCDVPCSGIGVLSRKPEVKEKDPETMKTLPPLQLQILEQGASYVKPDGILVYSTCTLLPAENEQVVQQFLQKHPEFVPEPVLPIFGGIFQKPMVTLFPDVCGSDGFFLAKLRRRPHMEK